MPCLGSFRIVILQSDSFLLPLIASHPLFFLWCLPMWLEAIIQNFLPMFASWLNLICYWYYIVNTPNQTALKQQQKRLLHLFVRVDQANPFPSTKHLFIIVSAHIHSYTLTPLCFPSCLWASLSLSTEVLISVFIY